MFKVFLLQSKTNYSAIQQSGNYDTVTVRNKSSFVSLKKTLAKAFKSRKKIIVIENCCIKDEELQILQEFLSENENKLINKRIILLNCTNSNDVTEAFRNVCKIEKKKSEPHSLVIENLTTSQNIIEEFKEGMNENVSVIHFLNCNLNEITELADFFTNIKSLTKGFKAIFEKCYGDENNIKELGSFFANYEIRPLIEVKINKEAESFPDFGEIFNINNLGNIAGALASSMAQQQPQEGISKSASEKQKELDEVMQKFSVSPAELEAQLIQKYKQNLDKSGEARSYEKNQIISQLPTFSIPRIFRNIKLSDEEMAELKGIFTRRLLNVLDSFIVGNPELKDQLADVFIEGIDSGQFDTNFLIYGYPGTGKSQMGCGLGACTALIDLYEEALKNVNKNTTTVDQYIQILKRDDIIDAAIDSYQRYFVLIPLNSCNDLASLFGSPSVFSGAGAGMFIKKMVECNQFFKMAEMKKKYPNVIFPKHISSPICVLDEIDKFNLTVNVQNSEEKSKETLSNILDKIIGEVKDEFVDIRIPSKYIFFLATANDISRLNSGFLGSRLPRKSELEGYTLQEKKNILIKKLFMDMINNRITDVNLAGFKEEENKFRNNIISIDKEALGRIVQLLTSKDLGIRLLQTIISNFLTNISKHISEEAIKRKINPASRKKPIKVVINSQNVLEYISPEIVSNNIIGEEVREMWRKGSISVISKSSKKDGAVEELTAILAQKHLGVSGGYYLITLLGGSEERDNRQMPMEISSYVTSLLTHTARNRRDFQNFVSQQKLFNLMVVNADGPQPFSVRELPNFAFCAALCVISILKSEPIRQDTIYLGFMDNQGVLFKDTSWKSKLILVAGSMTHIKHIVLPKQMQDPEISKFIKKKLEGRDMTISYCSHFNELVDIFISQQKENLPKQKGK